MRRILIYIACIIMLLPLRVGAAEYQDVIDEITNQRKDSIYNIELNAPYSKDTSGVRETINPENGGLSVNLSLFSLHGRGGTVPYTLTLNYTSANASDKEESAEYNSSNGRYYNARSSKTGFAKSIEGVGIGWRFNLPYVEVPDTRNKTNTYVHMPDGLVYKSKSGGNGLEEYKLNDVTFNTERIHRNNVWVGYRLIYVNGDVYYFNESGYLIEKNDKFGNRVYFLWSNDEIPKLVSVYDNCSNSISVKYSDTAIDISMKNRSYRISRHAEGESYLFDSISDPSGRITQFNYHARDMSFNFFYTAAGTNAYYLLDRITYHNGVSTAYEYITSKKWLYEVNDGYIEYAKISGRYEYSGTDVADKVNYYYTHEPDGYPNYKSGSLPKSYVYSTTELNSTGKRIIYTYDREHNQISKSVQTSSRAAETEEIEYDRTTRMPRKITSKTYNPSGAAVAVYTDTAFDEYGNVTRTDTYSTPEEAGTDVREYKYGTSNICVYESYMKDSETKIELMRDICPGGFAAGTETMYENGVKIYSDSYSYDRNGNLIKAVQQTGRGKYLTVRYTYAEKNSYLYPETVTYSGIETADGEENIYTVRYEYDKYGNCIKETAPDGGVTAREYDSADRLVKETLPDYTVRTYAYDDRENTILTTDGRKNKLLYLYDKYGRMKGVKDYAIDTYLMSRQYDEHGRVINETDANGAWTEYAYDALDRYTAVTAYDAYGTALSQTKLAYDEAFGSQYLKMYVTTGFAPEQRRTEYLFDRKNRMTAQQVCSDNGDRAYFYEYDNIGNNTIVTSPSGAQTRYSYDAFGNAVYAEYPDGRSEIREYDRNGNCISFTNGEGETEYYTYDAMSNMVKYETSDGTNRNVLKRYYDFRGNMIKQSDAKGNVTEYRYSERGFMESTLMRNGAAGMIAEYEYDAEGGMLSMRSGGIGESERRGISYTLDKYGRVVRDTDNLGQSNFYEYDLSGNLISATDRNGIKTTNVYDGLNRVIRTENSKEGVQSFEYNAFSETVRTVKGGETETVRYNECGEVVSVIRNDTTEYYEYDIDGNCISHTIDDKDIGEIKTGYVYDKAGVLTGIITGMGTEYLTYDKAGRISIKENSATGQKKQYDYLPNSLVSRIRTTQNGQLVYNEEFEYDANGNKILINENGKVKKYNYDALNRLQSVIEGTDITEYEYDSFNNISKEHELTSFGIKTKQYYYDENNRLILSSSNDDYEQYSYDNAGNLTKKTTRYSTDYYSYDGYNRLSAYYNGQTNAEYSYNVDGLRKSKTVNGNITRFVYDGANVVGELEKDNYYIYYRATELIGYKAYTGESYRYRQNAHGDVTAMLDMLGNEVRNYTYDAFGEKQALTAVPMGDQTILYQWKAETENVHNPFGYCGEYTDAETGLVYLRNRMYSPEIGRFITEDPIKDGLNWYAYCGNNPIMFVDLSGLAPDDHIEFGNGAVTKTLDNLGNQWTNTQNEQERKKLHNKAELIRNLERARRMQGLQQYPLGYKYNTVEAVEIIEKYSLDIENAANSIGMPKEMIESILYREMICFKIDDRVDPVKAGFFGDASLGLGQIFIKTAQNAEKFYYGKVEHDWEKMGNILMNDRENIFYIGLVLKHAANMVGIELNRNYDFYNVNKVFARYNGTNDAAGKYGRETSVYLMAFVTYKGWH